MNLSPIEKILNQIKSSITLEKNQVLSHQIEHAGFGAILSRLMTGLNLSIITNSNFYYEINSPYFVESMFNIDIKCKDIKNKNILVWDFFRDTWNNTPEIRGEHQFPKCPVLTNFRLSRHQWCSILAQIIIGNPSQELRSKILELKTKTNWNKKVHRCGIHVRRGDKFTENPILPIEIYIKYLKKITNEKKSKETHVFLASDSNSTYDEFCKYIPKDLIIYDHEEKRYDNYNAGMVLTKNELSYQESLTAAKNILLLGECDYVIGMSTAQFTWLGGLLAVFRANLDTERHIMINPFDGSSGHWSNYYGFKGDEY